MMANSCAIRADTQPKCLPDQMGRIGHRLGRETARSPYLAGLGRARAALGSETWPPNVRMPVLLRVLHYVLSI